MRRLLSLVLFASFVLPIVAPALALGQDPDAGLPVCCRRHGSHHCSMLAARQRPANTTPGFTERCPFYPQHTVAPVTGAHLLLIEAPPKAAPFLSTLGPAAHAETCRRIARECSHHKRGPPSFLLA